MSSLLDNHKNFNNMKIRENSDNSWKPIAMQGRARLSIGLQDYLIRESKRLAVEDTERFIVQDVPNGRLIFHRSFLSIAREFCKKYAKPLGLVNVSKRGIHTYMSGLYRTYFDTYKTEQRWSRVILDRAAHNLFAQGLISKADIALIATLVVDQDKEICAADTLVCLPTPYDDLDFYTRIGVSLEDWREAVQPYTKKDARGLIFASRKYPTDFTRGGDPLHRINDVPTAHDALTYDLYWATVISTSMREWQHVAGCHEGHYSYLEYAPVRLMALDGNAHALPHRSFIREGFALYRDGSRREKDRDIPSYHNLIALLAGPELEDTRLYYWAGAALVRTLHELVTERDRSNSNDDKRYTYMEEKALLAALHTRSQLIAFPNLPVVLTFIRQWINELDLEEALVRKKFESIM